LVTVTNVEPRHSDHRPIIIDTAGGEKWRREKGGCVVPKFEARWVEEEECEERIKYQSEQAVGVEGKSVKGGLKAVLGDLVGWSREVLGDLDKRINNMKKELEKWRNADIWEKQVRKEQLLRFKLSRLEDQRELYWKQRSHVHWMKEGDRNMKGLFGLQPMHTIPNNWLANGIWSLFGLPPIYWLAKVCSSPST
jgi:hypothetical protein